MNRAVFLSKPKEGDLIFLPSNITLYSFDGDSVRLMQTTYKPSIGILVKSENEINKWLNTSLVLIDGKYWSVLKEDIFTYE